MDMNCPNDSDGDALRRVAADGNDMTAPMVIEFSVVIPLEALAKRFASLASARGYDVELCAHDDDPEWDVICAITMVPTYAEIVRIQRDLTEWVEPFDGFCDGWGTFGNKAGGKTG